MKELDDITGAIVDGVLKIHKKMGTGLLESVYEVVLVSGEAGISGRAEEGHSV